MKTHLFAMGLILFTLSIASAEVLSFGQWKKRRIHEAQSIHDQIKAELSKKSVQKKKKKLQKMKARLDQARTNIRISKELNSQDYFVLYLSKNFSGDKKALERSAKKMSPGQVALIMSSYADYLQQSRKALAPQFGIMQSNNQ
jgi:hypothetical protein